jgi:NMD protein affecting ribosome stability and mRNA decay
MSNNFCLFCGNLRPTIQGMCEHCSEEHARIRSYIKLKPTANILELAHETKVSYKKIKLFIEEGIFILKR